MRFFDYEISQNFMDLIRMNICDGEITKTSKALSGHVYVELQAFLSTEIAYYMVAFRVSFLVLASVAAFAVARINVDRSRKPNSSIKKNDSAFLQEEIEEEEEEEEERDEFEGSKKKKKLQVEPKEKEEVKIIKSDLKPNEHENDDYIEFEFPIHKKKRNNVSEIEMSKKVKSEMEQRRVSLEVKLVELNGLKEHQLHMAELQKHLKAKTAEIDMLTATIIALQAERKKLYEEIKQNKLAEKQVEIAKKMILEMQAKKRVDADQMKGQLVMLQEQVNGFHMEETTKIVDAKVEKKLESMKDVELEIVRKKRRNKELQLEKRELSVMLAAAQAKITALSNMTERKILVKMEEELSSLRLVNENLRKQAERLQKNRFEMVEELVYQRWLNTCLRLEVQDYKTPRQSISSSDSHEKTSKLSFDYNFDSISSNAFTSESDKITTTTIDSSSTNQTSVHKKYGLIQYIKRWGRSRYDTSAAPTQGRSPPSRKGLIRRFSTSMVPEKTSMLKTKGDNATQTPETPSLPRKRRVSFNDSIQTAPSTFQDSPESVRGASDDERKSGQSCEDNRSVNTIAALEEEEPELSSLEMNVLENNNGSSNSSRQEMESEEMESRVVSKIDVPPSEKEVGNRRVHFVAAFFFLLLMLVVCFVFHTGGIYYLVPMVVVCNILFKTIGMY